MKTLSTLFFLLAMFTQLHAQNCIPNTNSIDFSGSGTYVSLPASSALNITDSLTIEAWVKSAQWGFSSSQNTILCKHGWSSGEGGYVLRAGGAGNLSFTVGADTGGVHLSWREIVSTATMTLNTWYHVAGTFDGTNLKVYINGVLSGTNTLPYPVNIAGSVNYNANIGKLADAIQPETRYWNGNIDEVRVWHRVLSQTEIASNMNNHIDTSTAVDLVGYWRLNDGTGTSASDWSGNYITGNILSGTWSTDVPFSDGPLMPTISYGYPFLYSSSSTNNQWNLNGTPIPGANFLSYIPTQNGSYTVTVTDSAGCSVTSAPYIITTLSIDETQSSQPVRAVFKQEGMLVFIGSPETISRAEINLYDLNGRLLYAKEKGRYETEIKLNKPAGGVFILDVNVDGSAWKTRIPAL